MTEMRSRRSVPPSEAVAVARHGGGQIGPMDVVTEESETQGAGPLVRAVAADDADVAAAPLDEGLLANESTTVGEAGTNCRRCRSFLQRRVQAACGADWRCMTLARAERPTDMSEAGAALRPTARTQAHRGAMDVSKTRAGTPTGAGGGTVREGSRTATRLKASPLGSDYASNSVRLQPRRRSQR
jgi:hypothetical protein